ncbi:MAG: polyamine ABC transporter ATP-binding protein [Oligoflexia bacterium]|nr:polyamine ABC transporter ATP-binding protein [Oligoflexia bacterium]
MHRKVNKDFSPPILTIRNLFKSFSNNQILKNISLDIYKGEFLTLLGPSGCGKTTMLRIIAGLDQPDDGNILFHGNDITDLSPNQRKINTVFQNYALFPHMNVKENLSFGPKMSKMPKREIEKRILEMLELLKLNNYGNKRVTTLSGGEQQRVALGRALINHPDVLLLDEPLSALDYSLRLQMRFELKYLQKKLGLTFIFVTHDQEEALSVSDRIVVMRAGEILQTGTPEDIYERPTNIHVAKFIGQANFFDQQDKETSKNIKIMVRPEDILLYHGENLETETKTETKAADNHEYFKGQVVETNYLGKLFETLVVLENNEKILVSHFYEGASCNNHFQIGEDVYLTWKKNSEVILDDE